MYRFLLFKIRRGKIIQFILFVKGTEYFGDEIEQSKRYTDALRVYKQSLDNSGILLAYSKLQPSSAGLKISYSSHRDDPEVQVGSFSLDQQRIIACILIDVRTEDEALKWALQMPIPTACSQYEIELRRLEEHLEPFRDPITKAMEADLQDLLSILKND